MYVEVKNNKMLFLTQGIELSLLFWYLTVIISVIICVITDE